MGEKNSKMRVKFKDGKDGTDGQTDEGIMLRQNFKKRAISEDMQISAVTRAERVGEQFMKFAAMKK